jgi:small conductance mechanosensitive channel
VLGIDAMSAEGVTIRITARTAPQKQDAIARAIRARIVSRLRRENIALAPPPAPAPAPAADDAKE